MLREYIVLIPVDFENSKEVALKNKGEVFVKLGDVAERITAELIGEDEDEAERVLVYSVEGFANACNEQEFESLSNYWMARVFVQ